MELGDRLELEALEIGNELLLSDQGDDEYRPVSIYLYVVHALPEVAERAVVVGTKLTQGTAFGCLDGWGGWFIHGI